MIFPGAGPRQLLAQLKVLRPAVINVHSPLPALWLKAAQRVGYFNQPAPRLIETIHSDSYNRPMFELASARLNPVLDRVVAVSDAVAASRLAQHAPQIDVVRAGVNVRAIEAWSAADAEAMRRRHGVAGVGVVLAMVAGFRPAKNHLRLVEAIGVLARSGIGPDEFAVLLVGDGPTRASVEHAISTQGLQEYVRFLGIVPQGWQVLASCDAAVLTSDREGGPVVAMEAIAAERPVLMTNVGAVGELIADGRNGLLFEPDAYSAAQALGRFAVDPELRARLQRHAGERREDVDIRRAAAAMERIYAPLKYAS